MGGGGGTLNQKTYRRVWILLHVQFETGMGGRAEGSSSLLCRGSFIKNGVKSWKWEEK